MQTGRIAIAFCGLAGAFWVQTTPALAIISTTTTLAVSPNPSTFGDSVILKATVKFNVNSGSVTFKDSGVTIGIDGVDGSGVATITTASLSARVHHLTAEYNGSGGFLKSTSATVD